jgi:hypothetical protein
MQFVFFCFNVCLVTKVFIDIDHINLYYEMWIVMLHVSVSWCVELQVTHRS